MNDCTHAAARQGGKSALQTVLESILARSEHRCLTAFKNGKPAGVMPVARYESVANAIKWIESRALDHDIYITLNPLFAPEKGAKPWGGKDGSPITRDVLCRHHILIDVDQDDSPDGKKQTDPTRTDIAIAKAEEIEQFLDAEFGKIARSFMGCSGRGAQLWIRCFTEIGTGPTAKVEEFVSILGDMFNGDGVHIDTGVNDLRRIARVCADGLTNHKPPIVTQCRMIKPAEDGHQLTLEDLSAFIEKYKRQPPATEQAENQSVEKIPPIEKPLASPIHYEETRIRGLLDWRCKTLLKCAYGDRRKGFMRALKHMAGLLTGHKVQHMQSEVITALSDALRSIRPETTDSDLQRMVDDIWVPNLDSPITIKGDDGSAINGATHHVNGHAKPETATSTTEAPQAADGRVEIQDIPSRRHETVGAILDVLSATPGLFVRNGRLVEVEAQAAGRDAGKLSIVEVSSARMASHILPQRVAVTRYDGKTKTVKPVNAARDLIEQILGVRHYPQLRQLVGIAEAGYFAPDGRFVDADGYDESACILKRGRCLDDPPIVGSITRSQFGDAAMVVEDVLHGLAFARDDESTSNHVRQGRWQIAAAAMTIQSRCLHRLRPAFLITAPDRGSGKTEVSELVLRAATGRESFGGVEYNGKDYANELFSHAGSGVPYLLHDDIPDGAAFGTSLLNRIVTGGTVGGRAYHQNATTVERPADFTIIANGNNVAIGADFGRRCIMTRLVKNDRWDGVSEPFGVRFRERAAEFARACAIVVGYHLQVKAADPICNNGLRTPENFREWADIVRDACWRASATIAMPIDVMTGMDAAARHSAKDDERAAVLEALWQYWQGTGRQPFRAADIVMDIRTAPTPSHAMQVAALLKPGQHTTESVSWLLRKHRDLHATFVDTRISLRNKRTKHDRAWTFEVTPLVTP